MKPFDLEAAKRGEPIQTRKGCKARFVAHLPEAEPGFRLVVFVEGDGSVSSYFENGTLVDYGEDEADLFMAPKKQTMWVNFYESGRAEWFDSKDVADNNQKICPSRMGRTAYPVEIDA